MRELDELEDHWVRKQRESAADAQSKARKNQSKAKLQASIGEPKESGVATQQSAPSSARKPELPTSLRENVERRDERKRAAVARQEAVLQQRKKRKAQDEFYERLKVSYGDQVFPKHNKDRFEALMTDDDEHLATENTAEKIERYKKEIELEKQRNKKPRPRDFIREANKKCRRMTAKRSSIALIETNVGLDTTP